MSLFTYSVEIWNSGDIAITDLPVRIVFNTDNKNFKITASKHKTSPPIEFGKITTQTPSQFSSRFTYELLNPGDSDKITLITNQEAPLEVYSKAPGLEVEKQFTIIPDKSFLKYLAIFIAAISLAASLLTTVLRKADEKFRLSNFNKLITTMTQSGTEWKVVNDKGKEVKLTQEQIEMIDTLREIAIEIISINEVPTRKHLIDEYSKDKKSVKIIQLIYKYPEATFEELLKFLIQGNMEQVTEVTVAPQTGK